MSGLDAWLSEPYDSDEEHDGSEDCPRCGGPCMMDDDPDDDPDVPELTYDQERGVREP